MKTKIISTIKPNSEKNEWPKLYYTEKRDSIFLVLNKEDYGICIYSEQENNSFYKIGQQCNYKPFYNFHLIDYPISIEFRP